MSRENATRLYKHYVATGQTERAEGYASKYPHVLEDSPSEETVEKDDS